MVGDRVVISPAAKPRRPPSPAPLHYATPNASRTWKEKAIGFLRAVGWRQIVFAFGLAFLLGGVAQVSAVMLFIGGLLTGLALRLPWLRG